MGKNIAIQVENLSKVYQLGQIGTGTISKDLERFWTTRIRGKEDPFLKIGQTNDRTIKGESDIVWSLKDLNFEIEQGDAVGIIGRNGAGKSTLLKLLSRVTSPTIGSIKVKGRIASLLEVGTGFHPELSGRENIYLNGAILGMRKFEIHRKFDEIVDFAGVERYIDTPVKRYSSGMYVRLAFAVAAHLESEILIVDEVLAVGDAEFQKKCLGKMGDISNKDGRTVLFVSHNMSAVKTLCSSGIVLSSGIISNIGTIDSCVQHYMENQSNAKSNDLENSQVKINKLCFRRNSFETLLVQAFDPIELFIDFEIKGTLGTELFLEFFVKDSYGTVITSVSNFLNGHSLNGNLRNEITIDMPFGLALSEGNYFVDLQIHCPQRNNFHDIFSFEIINNPSVTGYKKPMKRERFGYIYTPNHYRLKN